MAKSRVKDLDKGFKKLMVNVSTMAKGSKVEVGILGEDAEKEHEPEPGETASGVTIGEIGEFHEFGLGNNPVRSWLRGYVDPNKSKILEISRRLHEAVIEGKITEQQALETFGLAIKAGIQKRIASGIKPQVTEATQKRKGPSKTIPLINSGQFRSSINYKVTIK